MERVSPRIIGCDIVTFVTLLCDATRASAKDRGGGVGAETAAVANIIGEGTTMGGVGVGKENFACQSKDIAEFWWKQSKSANDNIDNSGENRKKIDRESF